MEKRKNGMQMNIEMNQRNLVIGAMVLVLLAVTGVLPILIELVVGVIGLVVGLAVGAVGLVIGLVAGAIGLVIGLLAGAIGLVIGLAPIVIPVAVIVYLVRNNNTQTEKPKNDFV